MEAGVRSGFCNLHMNGREKEAQREKECLGGKLQADHCLLPGNVLKWSEVTGHTVQPKGLSALMYWADTDPLKPNQTKNKAGRVQASLET